MPIRSNYPVVKSSANLGAPSFKAISQPVDLPPQVDLRSKRPPVVDQGDLGSCTGNAIASAYEFDMMKQGLSVMTPSRLFIYYNERVMEGTANQDSGAQIGDGIKVIANYGVCDETVWPYDIDQFTTKPSDAAYAEAQQHKALNYYSDSADVNSIKQALAQGYPLVCGITIYQSFESSTVAGNGFVPMPRQGEQCLGGHCVLVVGYDDSMQHFIFRNSWGPDWGDSGYFYLPYGYITPALVIDFWVITAVQ